MATEPEKHSFNHAEQFSPEEDRCHAGYDTPELQIKMFHAGPIPKSLDDFKHLTWVLKRTHFYKDLREKGLGAVPYINSTGFWLLVAPPAAIGAGWAMYKATRKIFRAKTQTKK